MSTGPEPILQSVLWGQAYEILVKRGVLTRLIEEKLITANDPRVAPWRTTRLATLTGALRHELDLLDIAARDVVECGVEHLALLAFGTGYTATREYLNSIRKYLSRGHLVLRGIYCPLHLPGKSRNDEGTRAAAQAEFALGFGLTGPVDSAWTDKGMPARADFALWLSGETHVDQLLVQEYSYDMAGDLPDFRTESAHLEEVLRHRRLIETRGVFARVSAEVDGQSFALSSDIKNHLLALTSENKPLYKLCQACGYGETTERVLRSMGLVTKPCVVRALAITPNGFESLAARFDTNEIAKEPRRLLMEQMGTAYRRAEKPADNDEASLNVRIKEAFNAVFRRLPPELRSGMKPLTRTPQVGEDYEFEFNENVSGFTNPARTFPLTHGLALIEDQSSVTDFFRRPASEVVGEALRKLARNDQVTLRDLHAAAVVAGLRAAVPGRLNVIAMEGNPGIGKTTAVMQELQRHEEGYLFAYLSPRVVINRDVTDKMARHDGTPTGTLTLTTNAALIASAERWYKAQVAAGQAQKKRVEAAVVVDGVPDLTIPHGSTLVLTPEQEAEIEGAHAGSRISKTTLSEHEDLVQERSLRGVLATMAETARELLELNPDIKRMVLTAALQGFRDKGGGRTTLESLSKLFRTDCARKAGLEERRRFAKRHPTIFIMVDELAGDGAGAPFVHAVSQWVQSEFIDCFEDAGEPSPYTVVLLIADASLANEVVLDRYLNSGQRAPEKVLISPSAGAKAFALAANQMRLGNGKHPVLHIMTNSFPASTLNVRYKVRLHHVALAPKDGVTPSPRKAIRDSCGEMLLASAKAEIATALERGAKQVIYFAQDKQFLGDLRSLLKADEDLGLDFETIAILDSSVPGSRRKKLIEPSTRDRIRVFLMTSSGARGVSFPKTDWIIAHVPRFSIECALMEISQLVYRGRGRYQDEASGEWMNGDEVPRQLVMLVDDFHVSEGTHSPRQWLRQSMDLLTLLVMLRATLLTRMTGDSGLRQPIAFVPVGGTGMEELIITMTQFVRDFLRESEVYLRRHPEADDERVRLVKRAQGNVHELFGEGFLKGVAMKGQDGRSIAREDEVTRLLTLTTSAVAHLIEPPMSGSAIADHMHFFGPLVYECWAGFDKHEQFFFEGHQTQTQAKSRQLFAQLIDIDEDSRFPSALRTPAANLRRLLSREKPDAANEFSTTKHMGSRNTWLVAPASYVQFVRPQHPDDPPYRCAEPEEWYGALSSAVARGAAVAPAVPKYRSFPWAAATGTIDPLKLEQVFDDRLFMASSELNLLNTLLLCEQVRQEAGL